jgi:medium-chain acyl-[acyl-carrier-protein] hydrolase
MSFTSTSGSAQLHASGQPQWLVVPEPKPAARARLICFPHAGGAPSAFFPWARALADYPLEVAAAHLPGREARTGEPPPDDLEVVIDALAGAIGTRADRPFALFGHSMGARLSFEVARRLRDRQAPAPACIFVSGAPAPQLPRVDLGLRFIEDDAVFLTAVADTYGGVPRIVLERAELRAQMVTALRADLTLTETYDYREGAPLACAIAAYGGEADPITAGERLTAWREQTTGGFSCRRFDGDHFYLHRRRDALLADVMSRLQPLL